MRAPSGSVLGRRRAASTTSSAAGLAALLNAVGALLGLIVLPTWMLALLTQKRRAQIAVDTQITPSLRRDAWALAAIVDRAAGSYLRGYVVAAALVGLLTYVGLQLSPQIGGPTFQQPLALATFAGVTQVVPIVGTDPRPDPRRSWSCRFAPSGPASTCDLRRRPDHRSTILGSRLMSGTSAFTRRSSCRASS